METARPDTGWAGVREQVLALRKAPLAARVFGAERGFGHEFLLDAPLVEAEVAAAEAEFGVRLPADYRTFLLEVGAGGAGPHYGLFPLRRHRHGWHWWDGFGADRPILRRDFLSIEERARLQAEHEAREPVGAHYPDSGSYCAAYETWDDEDDAWQLDRTAGAIRIGDQGCATFTWLVAAGPDRGTMWSDRRPAGPMQPFPGATGRLGFRDWYLDWLARATRQAHGR